MLAECQGGPLYWVDTADSQPCIGTGGIAAWTLTAYGKLFHSGLPHKSVNPIELAMDAVATLQRRFYADFPATALEAKYGFATPSTLKPTQWSYPAGSINQIPGQVWCWFLGCCFFVLFLGGRGMLLGGVVCGALTSIAA